MQASTHIDTRSSDKKKRKKKKAKKAKKKKGKKKDSALLAIGLCLGWGVVA